MDRDALYFHISNLILVLLALVSIGPVLNPFIAMILIPGTIVGFIVSWQIKERRPQQIDTFIGMLSLAAIIIIFGRLYDTAIVVDNLLKIFSLALAWLTFFQSFGLKTGKSYAMMQFISVSLLLSSVGLALEQEAFYMVLLTVFVFVFIFTMRLNLVCDKKRKGSHIIGYQREIMSLPQQIKTVSLMFSFILIVASFVYPLVPRFENISLRQIPSSIVGFTEQVPLLKMFVSAPKTVEDDKKAKEAQFVDDQSRIREINDKKTRDGDNQKDSEGKVDGSIITRFPSEGFDESIDIFQIESLTIDSDKEEVAAGGQCNLSAEIKLIDGSVIPVTEIVDWKVTGSKKVSVDRGILVPKEKGRISISASYLGSFSNDVDIKVTEALGAQRKIDWMRRTWTILAWLIIFALLGLFFWAFIRSSRLRELAIKDPREFIKEIYVTLCRGFKIYGIPRLDCFAHREFFEFSKKLVYSKPEPLCIMTENVLEARFSAHDISAEHSKKILGLFHDVRRIVLGRPGFKESGKKFLFTLLMLDVLMLGQFIACHSRANGNP